MALVREEKHVAHPRFLQVWCAGHGHGAVISDAALHQTYIEQYKLTAISSLLVA